jgi:uncharacterized protein involved in outer membrane biogenesis
MIRRIVLGVTGLVLVLLVAVGGFAYWMLAGDGVRLALERQATAWLGHPVRIAAARPRLFPRPGLRLEQVTVGDPVSLTLGTVDVSADGRALLSRRIEHAAIEVADSRIAMPLPFTMPETGETNPKARIPNPKSQSPKPKSQGVQLVSIDSIGLRDIVITSRGHALTVSGDSALAKSRLAIRSFTARTDKTTITAEGEVDLEPRIDALLKVKANRLDVDELLALANAFAPPASRSSRTAAGEPPRIAARISSETASAGGVDVRQFATDFEIIGGRVSLSPLTFQLFGGRYQGSLAANLANTMTATLRSRVIDVDVAQLAEFGGSPGTISGHLTGAGTFSGSGADFAGVLKSVRGEGTATITDGNIKRLDLVRTVVLFFGRPAPDAGASSDKFDRLDATFSVANQVVRAEALSLHSQDADLVGNGTLSLDSKALSGRVDMSLSEALTKQAGTDLARYTREGNRIVLPATIGGTLDRPRIAIDAAAAVQRGLKNEIQRRLGGLLDKFKRAPADSTP